MPRKQKDGKYKLKTHKATSKRFKMTGSGEIMRTKIGKGHLRRRTPDRTKRLFERMLPVKTRGLKKRVKRLAPYMSKKK
ncbi:MAG: large ribosomal subunit protein bL35 [Brevefilum sp.]